MAVRLRLRREGAKKAPYFRIVAADQRAPRDGRFIEILGHYHPTEEPSRIEIDEERALHWLRNGAQPTSQVENLLRITGVWERFRPGQVAGRGRAAEQARATGRTQPAGQVSGIDEVETGPSAPEEVTAATGAPENATAEPVAATQAAASEGAPGEGVAPGSSAPEQTPTTGPEEEA